QTQEFTSGGCGAFPISASITTTQASGAKPMDPWTVMAVSGSGAFFSNDSDPAFCPARFATPYTFAWSANDAPPATFNTDTSKTTIFTPANHQLYTVHVVVSGNGQSGVADHAVDANCGAPAVSTPVIASVNALSPTGTVYVDDVVEIATSAVSQCFASPTFSYAYTISLNSGASDAAFSPTANVAQPTFVPRTFGGTYAVSVTISDATGQPGSPV